MKRDIQLSELPPPQRERLLTYLAACTPHPAAALNVLRQFPEPHPAYVQCWPWNRGCSRDKPIIQFRPHHPSHPIRYFYDLRAIKRICDTRLCVNPYHYVCAPHLRTQLARPWVMDAEEMLEEQKCKSLEHAYRLIGDTANGDHFTLQAYRSLRQRDWASPRFRFRV